MNRYRSLLALALALCLGVSAGAGQAQQEASAAVPAPPALRLPDTAQPIKQVVELRIQPSQEGFSGVAEIEIELKQGTPLLWLHGRDLKVKEASARVGGAALAARVEKGGEDFLGFSFERPLGPGRVTLQVSYEGVLNRKDTEGLFAQQEGGDWYVFSQFESIAARRAFPSFDEPSFKIPWTIKLRVPQALAALSNAPEATSTAHADGTKTVSFAETPPLPSYLVAIAVGPFELVDAGTTSRKHAAIRIVTPRGRAGEARWAAQTTPLIVKQLEDYFDIPYPYAKLDQVAIPVTVGFGAMENAGLVTYQQAILLRKPEEEDIGFRRGFAGTAAHELAHMWFGDLVTTAWWDDIWLNESFASWMGAKVVDRWKPEWDVKVQRVFSRGGAMNQDSLATARKIRQPISSNNDIINAFDGITYAKGEAILEMFESWLGDEPFRSGVRLYLQRHAWRNATAGDFLNALSEGSGRGVTAAFSTFLEQSGVPLVSADLLCGAGKPKVALAQRPYRPIGSKDASSKTWQIPVCVRYGGAVSGRQCTLLTTASAELALAAPSCPDWLQPNDQGAGYYRVAYRGELLDRLVKDGGRRLNIPERVSLLGDLAALVRSGEVKAGDALAVVPVMLQDPSRHLVSATATLVGQATGNIVPDELRPRLARFIRETYGERARALGWQAKPGEDEDTRLLRRSLVGLVALQGEDKALGAEAVGRAQRWLEDPRAIDTDMLNVVLSAAARNGDRALFERFRDEAKKAQERLKRQRLLGAIGAFRDPAIVQEAFKLAFDDALDPRESMGILFGGGGGEPKVRRMAWDYFKQNFDAAVARLPREILGFLPFAGGGFCDADTRSDVAGFFQPRVAAFMGGPRNLAQVLEGTDLCIAYKDAQQASVVSFLEKY